MQYFEINVLLAIAVSFVAALIAGFIIIPLLRKAKAGQYVRDDGPQSHLKKAGTPTMGGFIFIFGLIVCFFAIFDDNSRLISITILVTIAYAILGFLDDFLKIKFKHKKRAKFITESAHHLKNPRLLGFFFYLFLCYPAFAFYLN